MKYTAQSCKYISKHFLYIFPLTILPAIFLTFSTDRIAFECMINTISSGNLSEMHFDHIFRAISLLNFGSVKSVIFGILCVICTILFVALTMAFLEKHLRIGKKTFNGILLKLNDNFVSTCVYVLLFLTFYEIWALLTSLLVLAISRIPDTTTAYILGVSTYLGMHVLLILAINLIYLWLPCMQFTGFRALEAFHYSYQLVAPVKWGIAFGQLMCLLIGEALICSCVVLTENSFAFYLLTAIVYEFLMMLYCVRMQIVYFDRDNIERADLNYYSR